jgi:aspartate-semialdehyde dehydrogenase
MAAKAVVVGVGMVGETIISVLKERDLPIEWPPRVCATRERTERLAGEEFRVEMISEEVFKEADVALFAGKEGARGASVQWRKTAEAAGALCIDNGKDFRLDDDVPLVIPEINLNAIRPEHRFVASPNCSAIQLAMALAPIHRHAGIRRVVVSTYQSVSGWGVKANQELADQVPLAMRSLDDIPYDPAVMARPIAFNLLPHIDSFKPDGYTGEEMKTILETKKILGDESIRITATTVRVPVFVGHGMSINIETVSNVTAEQALHLLSDFPGVTVLDTSVPDNPRKDPLERNYPTALDLRKPEYRDEVLVGRIREDATIENGLNLWCVSDNLRKGAALNVVQIWEALSKQSSK